ncbi:DctP family TRAP transporter solute-binding subunit [Alicyclobacillus sp. SO9]|uniref:DctP family TRAP transporter solute-binding subunit n=1 Tax=Alicyclobacillus sp. SO9 TaxID=2665646 RepID=UPI0018E78D3B|nr:DctP family TRAP transporter solute-binding subunit [Alicyclobacillus sp. SO9]QQE80562.1 DctP family TRAP transporter solute-binding subunit [Alicyclobacillus sp. SO9]
MRTRFNRYYLTLTAATVATMALVAGCGTTNTASNTSKSNSSKSSAANGKTITLTYSTVATPDQLEVKAAKKFISEVESLTNNKVKIKLYTSGSLYGQDAALPAVEQGNLDMTTVSAATLAPQVPELGMFTAAYTFKNYTAMDKVLNGSIGKKLFKQVAQKTHVLPLDAWYLGNRELNYRNVGHAIKTPQDMKGVKLRMPDAKAWLNLGKALGANPVPLSFSNVYTSLQTGTIDAQDNPLPTDKADKFYEVAKNISLTNHVIDSIWPAISDKAWNKLTPSEQSDMQKAVSDAGKWMAQQTIQQQKTLVKWFQQHGVTIVHPDVNAFYKYAQNWYKTHPSATKGWNKTLLKQVQQVNASVK